MDYHSRMQRLDDVLMSGELGDVEIAGMFSGKASDPFQIATRDRKTGRVSLLDLDLDGNIEGIKIPGAAE
jgi:hypothetical protein